MTIAEIKNKFQPSKVDLGVLEDGAIIPYSIQNNSEYDIQGFTKSCGCVGNIQSGPREITGDFPAKYKESNQELYKVDGAYCQMIPAGGVVKFYNVEKQGWAENPTQVDGPFKAHQFTQTITVKMRQEGVTDEIVKEDGELIDNPERLKFMIPITCWILKSSES